jgi:hypothetical protein
MRARRGYADAGATPYISGTDQPLPRPDADSRRITPDGLRDRAHGRKTAAWSGCDDASRTSFPWPGARARDNRSEKEHMVNQIVEFTPKELTVLADVLRRVVVGKGAAIFTNLPEFASALVKIEAAQEASYRSRAV